MTLALHARGVFWPYAWAPVINNLVFVSVLLSFRAAFGSADGLEASACSAGGSAS